MTSASDFDLAGLSVSRETFSALQSYESLLRRWTPAINLVSKATLPEFWQRHIVDSAQLFALRPPESQTWADLGSGGGLPGLVIAILAKEFAPDMTVTLVESDLRKATFLREVIRTLSLRAEVRAERIESTAPLATQVLSARALAPLSALLAFADRHLRHDGVALFPKGARHADELDEARKAWRFDVTTEPSKSDSDAAILIIRNIHRASQH